MVIRIGVTVLIITFFLATFEITRILLMVTFIVDTGSWPWWCSHARLLIFVEVACHVVNHLHSREVWNFLSVHLIQLLLSSECSHIWRSKVLTIQRLVNDSAYRLWLLDWLAGTILHHLLLLLLEMIVH